MSASLSREDVADIAPLLRRAADLDPAALVRLRRKGERLTALVRLPFRVLAARTITLERPRPSVDVAVRAVDLLAWLDGERDEPAEPRDADWRGAIPPASGWRRVDTVPDSEVRPLVRAGAEMLQTAAVREGVPNAQPRAEVAEALLDSVVLTVADGARSIEITLRTLSGLIRLGFVPRGSYVAIDVAGRWVRMAAAYGSVFAERPGGGLDLITASSR